MPPNFRGHCFRRYAMSPNIRGHSRLMKYMPPNFRGHSTVLLVNSANELSSGSGTLFTPTLPVRCWLQYH